MKVSFLPLRQAIILSLAIVVLPTFLVHAEQIRVEQVIAENQHEKSRYGLFDAFIESCYALGETITGGFHALVEFFEDIFYISHYTVPVFNYDVTLVGFVNFADGIGRHPILFKECLGSNIKINFLSTRNIPPAIEDAQLGLPRLDPINKQDVGAFAILTDILADKALTIYNKMPGSYIKVAYTMFESTDIPYNWASILNSNFDMAVVPDKFLVDVYKKSGVQIPIFVLPLPLMLQDFLKLNKPSIPHTPFVFGITGGFWERKNHMRALEAFAAEFGNRTDVKLRLHGRFGEESVIKALSDKIKEYNLSNVELIVKPYDWNEYLEFFKSLDCYVFLSKGEGFSITPREALACALPCILTKNTAQITICDSGAVRVVPSNILVPAIYDCYDANNTTNYGLCYTKNFLPINNYDVLDNATLNSDEIDWLLRSASIGYQFDCSVQDARDAMRDVYSNYAMYLSKAIKGRAWVKRYLQENLSTHYVSLVKPEFVALGHENTIGDKYLITNSRALYEKYKYLLGNK